MTAPPAEMRYRRAVRIVTAVFALLWLYLGALAWPQGRAHDFQYSYGAARLVLEGRTADLYGHFLTASPLRGLPYDRPAAVALLYVPFAVLPPDAGFVCYTAVWVILLACCWLWGWRTFGYRALPLAAMFMPPPIGLAHGQDCVLYLALLIWSYSLASRGRFFAAGCAVGLMALKFHLVLIWPVALIFERRWKMLAGFAAASFLLAGTSLAMVGVSGTRAYLGVLQKSDPVSPSPEFGLGFPGLLANLGIHSITLQVLGAAAVVGVFVWSRRRDGVPHLYAAATAASLAMVPHVYGYDAARLLLPIWLVYCGSESQLGRLAAVAMATPFVYSFTLLGKPWAAAGPIATLAFLVVLAVCPLQAAPLETAPKEPLEIAV